MKTKTKITVAVVSVLSVVALAGTGYAGWVISQNATQDTTGNVVVYNVKNNGVTLTDLNFTKGKGSIIWGKADRTSADTSKDWFVPTDEDGVTMEKEFFTPELSFTVTNKDEKDFTKPNVVAELEIVDSNEAYKSCVSTEKNLIKGPAVNTKISITDTDDGLKASFDPADATSKKNSYKVTLSVGNNVFGWGTHFSENGTNPVNPVNYYNQHTADEKISGGTTTYFDDATASMAEIYKLTGVTFKITITVSHGSSATKGN